MPNVNRTFRHCEPSSTTKLADDSTCFLCSRPVAPFDRVRRWHYVRERSESISLCRRCDGGPDTLRRVDRQLGRLIDANSPAAKS